MQMCDNTVFVLGGQQYVSYRAVIGVVTAVTVVIPVVSCHQPTAAAGNPALARLVARARGHPVTGINGLIGGNHTRWSPPFLQTGNRNNTFEQTIIASPDATATLLSIQFITRI